MPIAPSQTATIWFEVGQVEYDEDGYEVLVSYQREVALPADRMPEALYQHVADEYPGLELIDWVDSAKPSLEF